MTGEIAHLLGLPHRVRGVMRATLGAHELDGARLVLAFTAAEDKQLRAGVSKLAGTLELAEAVRPLKGAAIAHTRRAHRDLAARGSHGRVAFRRRDHNPTESGGKRGPVLRKLRCLVRL